MRGMSSGLIKGGLIGAALGIYAMSQMKPKERKRMMKRGRRMLSKSFDDMSLF